MPTEAPARNAADARSPGSTQGPARQVAAVLSFNLACYFLIGLPMAVVPGHVHERLGYGVVMAGAAVSSQYLATLATRSWSGRMCDVRGPKSAVVAGMALLIASGGCMLLADPRGAMGDMNGLANGLALSFLFLARLLLGAAESLVTTGALTWGIGRAGAAHTARVISWNGLASFGGIAAGAPAGALLAGRYGWHALGMATVALAAACLLLAARRPAMPPAPGERMKFSQVFAGVLPYGLCLALGSMGFGAVTSFITLYYARMGWPNAALALSVLGMGFVLSRLLLANAAARFGGYRVAYFAYAGEAAGLLLICAAPSPLLALAGVAIAGFCFAPLFPALGMVAVQPVPPASRGSAIGTFALFFDIGLGATGPVAGFIAGRLGYGAVYLIAAIAALAGLACTAWLQRRSKAASQ